LPVREDPPPDGAPTRFEAPLVLVELDMALEAKVPAFPTAGLVSTG
jgi:hypothetical protein